MIMYILQPGRVSEPDQRCIPRLLRSLSDPACPFIPALPLPVKSILSSLRRHDLHSVAIAWWQFNRRTPFFRHPQTARIVRSILKDGEAPAPM